MNLVERNGVLSASYDMTQQLKDIFSQVKEKFDDHLTSINENTNETQANYEYICELDAKIDKLSERIDQIQMFLSNHGLKVEEKPEFIVQKLTKREQEVFLVLYTLDGTKDQISYLDVAKRTCLTEELAMGYIDNMIRKGVPIVRKHVRNRTLLRLNPYFKTLQAKENILKLDQKTLV
ncbi:MAG: hypothetical protein ABIC04_02150 [Nanoarchaeota archaeon]